MNALGREAVGVICIIIVCPSLFKCYDFYKLRLKKGYINVLLNSTETFFLKTERCGPSWGHERQKSELIKRQRTHHGGRLPLCRTLAAVPSGPVRHERVCCRPETGGSVGSFGGRRRRLRSSRYWIHTFTLPPASFHRGGGLQNGRRVGTGRHCLKGSISLTTSPRSLLPT